MADIYSFSLVDILPESLKSDPNVVALAESLTPEIHELSKAIPQIVLLATLDQQPEEVVDLLAWQFHVDFYSSDLPIEQKRELVKQSFANHMRKGTPWAVEQVVSTVFVDGKVTEWFEYGGEPYHFKVTTKGSIPDVNTLHSLYRAIDVVKRKSTRLEAISIERDCQTQLYVGAAMSRVKLITINPEVS
ncbi:phage tail protein I [Brevibacillus aydinogluensis]|uniref:Phage tail protein I n=1 Tax=Brevibacillus aydinogluensis TaxID=927786 RepID=A0AA48MCB8_9BACL|nr:phage tail protein I [Brevibacillus aydinogluensis]CAJ1003869.1 phage tail protein I [Brevibacillus aydinogluensis]